MKRDWLSQTNLVMELLSGLVVDERGRELNPDKGFAAWAEKMVDVRTEHRRIYLVGNGPSASLANQFSTDIARRGHLLTEVFTDASQLSAIANDMGYEWVFAEPLRRRARKGDMLICISTSGRSLNILKAADIAKRLGLHTISLSACEINNPLRRIGELNFYLAARSRGDAHTCFQVILHHAVNLIKIDESQTAEIKYDELFTDLGRPSTNGNSHADPDSAFFLP